MIADIHLIYFSPTNTTQTVLKSIAKGVGVPHVHSINIAKDFENITFAENSVVIIGVPVYSGRIPAEASRQLKNVNGIHSKAVLVAVYGNRHYDDALVELQDISEKQGFDTVCAAAFIGEHSFSTSQFPIAANRPDKEDLLKAEAFGLRIKALLESGECFNGDIPGNRSYKDLPQYPDVAPVTNAEVCGLCGVCADVCPSNAISLQGAVITNAEACIQCCACVKACASNARFNDHDFFNNASAKLHVLCADRREPELFI